MDVNSITIGLELMIEYRTMIKWNNDKQLSNFE